MKMTTQTTNHLTWLLLAIIFLIVAKGLHFAANTEIVLEEQESIPVPEVIVEDNVESKTLEEELPEAILYRDDGSIDTSNWETYTNEEFGFSVRYPSYFLKEYEDVTTKGFSFGDIKFGISHITHHYNPKTVYDYYDLPGTVPLWLTNFPNQFTQEGEIEILQFPLFQEVEDGPYLSLYHFKNNDNFVTLSMRLEKEVSNAQQLLDAIASTLVFTP